jgi:hypothetical protein
MKPLYIVLILCLAFLYPSRSYAEEGVPAVVPAETTPQAETASPVDPASENAAASDTTYKATKTNTVSAEDAKTIMDERKKAYLAQQKENKKKRLQQQKAQNQREKEKLKKLRADKKRLEQMQKERKKRVKDLLKLQKQRNRKSRTDRNSH